MAWDINEVIKDYRDGMKVKDILTRHGMSKATFYNIIREQGEELRGPRGPERRYDHQIIIEDYLSGMTLDEIAEKHEMPHRQVISPILKKHGIERDRSGGPKPLSQKPWNPHLFSERTPTAAYWAGFIMADGSLSKSGAAWCLSLSVHEKDIEHLYAYCDAIELSRDFVRLQEQRYGESVYNMARVQTYFHDLPEIMRPWGIVPRKTYNFVAPDLPEEVLPHYLRGWFDGDGCVVKNGNSLRFGVTGNHEAMQWYRRALKQIGFRGRIIVKRPGGKVWARLSVYGVDKVANITWLLKANDSFKLERKWSF